MKKESLHIICQAHLDPVWLWPWRDGFAGTGLRLANVTHAGMACTLDVPSEQTGNTLCQTQRAPSISCS